MLDLRQKASNFMCEMMKNKNNNSTDRISSLVPKLVEAGLVGDRQRLELLSLNTIRTLKGEFPEMTNDLGDLMAKFATCSAGMRWKTAEPMPTDLDAGLALVRLHQVDNALEPILEIRVQEVVQRFLRERREAELLLRQGFSPPRTLLLKGAPGTGKTMLAQWLSIQLGLKLVVLDLATSISSYLGKTGGNLRRSLDYGRATPCVLLLDEFDAIGKRRDDATEVGELKRIVNVLLKELEEWPLHSVLVAATNHPDLLDPAIHRRFDVVLELPLPGEAERERILTRACGQFATAMPDGLLRTLAIALAGLNGSELDGMAQAAARRHVIEQVPLARCFVEILKKRLPGGLPKKELGVLVKSLQKATALSVRDIAQLVGKSSSTIQYHLRKE
jgi:SpoVK/Ycf46/Vps4 family AAA+-type ATPase